MAAAQSQAAVNTYTFSADATVTFAPLSNANPLPGIASDEAIIGGVPIGFDFWFDGVRYNHVAVSSNGFLTFNPNFASVGTANDLDTPGTLGPAIAPLWDDLNLNNFGSVSYQTSGVVGQRVLAIEWSNVQWDHTATAASVSCQAKLYEDDGRVEFWYDSLAGAVTTGSASVGLMGAATTDFVAVDNNTMGAGTTVTTVTADPANVSVKPATDLKFTFTPPTTNITPPTLLAATNVTGRRVVLNWVNTSTNPSFRGTAISVSEDGGNTYEPAITVGPGVTTMIFNGLGWASQYYWKLVAISDGYDADPVIMRRDTNNGNIASGSVLSVGAGGDYTSLANAFTDLQNQGLAGPVTLELRSDYVTETLPITIPSIFGPDSDLTIRPAATATGLNLENTTGHRVFVLNGTGYVTIDGRPGGTGTTFPVPATNLTIGNSLTTTQANTGTIVLRNGARHNTFQYLNLNSANPGVNTGAFSLFCSTAGLPSTSNNTIQNCEIQSNAAGLAGGLVYIADNDFNGGAVTIENSDQWSRGNVVSNNRISNFLANANPHAGIRVNGNVINTTVTGNQIYQTAIRNYTGATDVSGIRFLTGIGGGNIIRSNTIGPNPTGTGPAAWTVGTVPSASRAQLLFLNNTSANTTSVDGNIIKDFSMTTTSAGSATGGLLSAILQIGNGHTSYGTTSPNTIGSQSSADNIAVVTSNAGTANSFVAGFRADSAFGRTLFANNLVGGLSAKTTTATGSCGTHAISVTASTSPALETGAYYEFKKNTIGGTVTGSIQAGDSTSTTGTSDVRGIRFELGATGAASPDLTGTLVADGNAIRNLRAVGAAASTAGRVQGIVAGVASDATVRPQVSISRNTLSGFINQSGNVGTEGSSAVVAINNFSPVNGAVISGNTITTMQITNTAASAARIGGINIQPATVVTTAPRTAVTANIINSFTNTTTAATSAIVGINASTGVADYVNNMVSLGNDGSGASITGGNLVIIGLRDNSASQLNVWASNSVYIGGTGVAGGTSETTAFDRTSNVTAASLTIRNNIFFSARTGTGTHLCERWNRITNTTASNNLLFSSSGGIGRINAGTGAGLYNAVGTWTTNSGEISVATTNPQYNAPSAGTLADLRIKEGVATPIEGAGIAIVGFTTDAFGQSRSALTPEDIGAHAGNFVTSTAPTLTSVSRSSPSIASTNADTVTYLVTFSEAVSGVDAADFSITWSGTGTPAISSVQAISGVATSNSFHVTLTTGTGDGNLTLNALNDGTIKDGTGNALGGVLPTSDSYAIDRSGPQVSSILRLLPAGALTNLSSVQFRVTFSEAVANVNSDAFSFFFSDDGVRGPAVTSITGGPSVYDVTVSTGVGQLGLALVVPSGTSIADTGVGNLLANAPFGNQFYVLDRTSPTAGTATAPALTNTSPATVSYASVNDPIAGVASNGTTLYARTPVTTPNYVSTGLTSTPVSGAGSFNYLFADGNGTYDFALVSVDNVGNSTTNPPTVALATSVFDTVAPATGVIDPLPSFTNTSPATVSYSGASDATAGLDQVELYYSTNGGSTWTSAGTTTGSSNSFSFSFPDGDGNYAFALKARDLATNSTPTPNNASFILETIVFDSTAPSTGSMSPMLAVTNVSPMSVSYTGAADATAGLDTVELYYSTDSGSSWTSAGITTGASSSFNFAFPAGDGTYDFALKATDLATNSTSTPFNPTFILDSTVFDATSPVIGPLGAVAAVTNANPTTVSYSGTSDALSGVASVELFYSINSGSSWTFFGSSAGAAGSFNFTFPDGDAVYDFAMRAVDAASNASATPSNSSFILDSALFDATAPTSAASGPMGALTQADSHILVTWNGSDAFSGFDAVRLFVSTNGGPYTEYAGGPFTASPIDFDSMTVGGNSANYDMYTIGIDEATNEEAAPASADININFNNVTSASDWAILEIE